MRGWLPRRRRHRRRRDVEPWRRCELLRCGLHRSSVLSLLRLRCLALGEQEARLRWGLGKLVSSFYTNKGLYRFDSLREEPCLLELAVMRHSWSAVIRWPGIRQVPSRCHPDTTDNCTSRRVEGMRSIMIRYLLRYERYCRFKSYWFLEDRIKQHHDSSDEVGNWLRGLVIHATRIVPPPTSRHRQTPQAISYANCERHQCQKQKHASADYHCLGGNKRVRQGNTIIAENVLLPIAKYVVGQPFLERSVIP